MLPAWFGATSVELGAGVVATVSQNVSLFAIADTRRTSTGRTARRSKAILGCGYVVIGDFAFERFSDDVAKTGLGGAALAAL